jgi:hypothetical protein
MFHPHIIFGTNRPRTKPHRYSYEKRIMIDATVTTVDNEADDDERGHDSFTATHKMNDAPGAGTTCPWMPGSVPGSGR